MSSYYNMDTFQNEFYGKNIFFEIQNIFGVVCACVCEKKIRKGNVTNLGEKAENGNWMYERSAMKQKLIVKILKRSLIKRYVSQRNTLARPSRSLVEKPKTKTKTCWTSFEREHFKYIEMTFSVSLSLYFSPNEFSLSSVRSLAFKKLNSRASICNLYLSIISHTIRLMACTLNAFWQCPHRAAMTLSERIFFPFVRCVSPSL